MNNLANVFGLISHSFWRKTDHIILRGSQFLRVGNSQFGDNTLGIGTIAPDAPLHVYAPSGSAYVLTEVASTAPAGFQAKNTDGDWLAYTTGGKWTLRDMTAAVNRFWVDGNGNVGIGTASPEAKMHVAGRMRSESGMGWRHTKSCANNTATNIATLTMPTTHLLMTALVTLSVSASGKRAIRSYIVSLVYGNVDVTAMGSPTFTGVTTLTLTAAATTGSKLLTLTALQNSGAAETVEINVQPIAVHAEEVATFAGL